MENPIVSVVVPMYNAQKYAAECIDSIINQTYPNIEIILVNDGSTDSTLEICKKYAANDERIKIVDKENGGPTSCRLMGKNQATGEYIYFSDSDDVLDKEIIEKLLTACLVNNAEVSACGFKRFGGSSSQEVKIKHDKPIVEKNEFNEKIILPAVSAEKNDTTDIPTFYWNHLYKAECLTEDCFVSDRLSAREDTYTNLKILKNVNRIAIVDEPLYNYRLNTFSITVAYREGKLERDLYYQKFVKDFLEANGLSDEKRMCALVFGSAYGNIDNFCKSGSYRVFKNGLAKMYSENEINSAVKASLSLGISNAQKITGRLYCKKLTLALYIFRKLILKSKGIS